MNQRAQNGGGIATDVSAQANAPGIFGRLRAAYQYISTGSTDWFGPRDPLPPVAPPEVKEQGRALDYMTGYNQNLAPRAMESISFAQLRTLADSYDLMRLIIETRKDQVSRMKWNIKPRDLKQQADARCASIAAQLRRPDKEHDWDTWMRALMEDMLVIDAATIYPRKTRGGDPYSLDLIDGATIKRVIGEDGRTPDAPAPAYQQILKGVPAADFTREELLYRVRNWRVHRIYGYSPVEQVIMTVNIALRRQVSQLQYYTEGNVPEALIGVPENWTVEQIRQFQTYWDDLMEGNTAKRRHAKFVPGGMEYQPTREATLKDMYDEWLARVVCFAFSVSPSAFIAQVNRATAQVAQDASMEEGLGPVLVWLKNTMDVILETVFNAPDLEFDWVTEVNLDPEARARVHKLYIDAKVMTDDEVREELGREALTPEQREQMSPTPPPELDPNNPQKSPIGANKQQPGKQSQQSAGAGEEDASKADGQYLGSAISKKAKSPTPINRDRRAAQAAEKRIRSACEKALADVCDEAIDACSDIGKAINDGKKVADALRLKAFDKLAETLADIFTDLVKDAGRQALVQIDMDDPDMLELTNERAVEWAREHAAELIGKKWVGGKLVDNPNAAYRIDQVTRDGVQSLVTQAVDEGWSNDKLASALADAYVFSPERAELIAATETAYVDIAGNMMAYKDSGVVKGKKWIIANIGDVCPTCTADAAAGVIGLDEEFPSGRLAPPGHPKCKCDVLPVTKSKS